MLARFDQKPTPSGEAQVGDTLSSVEQSPSEVSCARGGGLYVLSSMRTISELPEDQ